MIRFLDHQDIDKGKWDQCIRQAPNGNVYAFSWYLDRVCKNWKALVKNDYETVFPLTHGKKYGIQYLYQPYFAQQLGVFSKGKINSSTVEQFLDIISARYKFFEIVLNVSNPVDLSKFEKNKNRTFELDLAGPYDDICNQYSENTKRNVTKALKNQIIIKKESNIEELIGLFRNNLGKKIKKIKTIHYNNLRSVMIEGLNRKLGEVYAAYGTNGKYCAGAYFLFSMDSFVFLFSASSPESRENGAMFLIIDNFIKAKAGSNYLIDFQGSNIESLARFYRGFGSKPMEYLSIRQNKLPWPVRVLKR
ncbi:MAG: hypothetical protein KAX05_07945 [Bacteroidales bacterium]|nr:hypothetical protein [Bacteroidales bacterium]